MKSYSECLDFLFSSLPMYQRLGAAAYKEDLKTSLELDRMHGHPHRSFKSVHIAGTNGKGSVSHMLASVLQAAGYKTGLYTSPHLKDFRERIRINGKMIPENRVCRYVGDNEKLLEELKPSFFEMTVDLAFLYFAEQEIDIAVIETGMGGRLDSTNIVMPELSVITNIGLDHTRFLGETLEEIAAEKAGIIKPRVPVVIGEYHPSTFPVFSKKAEQQNSELILAENNLENSSITRNADGTVNHYIEDKLRSDQLKIKTDLIGHYQKKNILTSLEALLSLRELEWDISDEHMQKGMQSIKKSTGLRGRWEEIGHNPLLICDTAHNAEGIKLVMEQLKSLPRKRLHIVWSMVSDKNPQKILRLLPRDAHYYFTKADIPRSMHESLLKELAEAEGLNGRAYVSSSLAFSEAKNHADPEDIIFIGGSSFLVGELLPEE